MSKPRTASFKLVGALARAKASARLEGGSISAELEEIITRYEATGDSTELHDYIRRFNNGPNDSRPGTGGSS